MVKWCSHHPTLLQQQLLQYEVELQHSPKAADVDEQLNATYKLGVIAGAVWCHVQIAAKIVWCRIAALAGGLPAASC